jgi:hypothetical protein
MAATSRANSRVPLRRLRPSFLVASPYRGLRYKKPNLDTHAPSNNNKGETISFFVTPMVLPAAPLQESRIAYAFFTLMWQATLLMWRTSYRHHPVRRSIAHLREHT